MPAVTNTTACEDGFFTRWKDWCLSHAVNCIGNMTTGDYPPIISEAREQYVNGCLKNVVAMNNQLINHTFPIERRNDDKWLHLVWLERQGHMQTRVDELEMVNQSLRNRDKLKDDAIAHLSDQLIALTARLDSIEKRQ